MNIKWRAPRIQPGRMCLPGHSVVDRICDDRPCHAFAMMTPYAQCPDVEIHVYHGWYVEEGLQLIGWYRCPGRRHRQTRGEERWEECLRYTLHMVKETRERWRLGGHKSVMRGDGYRYGSYPARNR